MRSSPRICLTSVALKNYVVRWTTWRSKTTRTTLLQNENWRIRSNTVGSDTMRVRHQPDFKQALSTLQQLKHQEEHSSAKMEKIPYLGGTGKNPGGILLMRITTKTDPALNDQGNLLKSVWDAYSRYDSHYSLAVKHLDRLQLTAVYCNRRRGVNTAPYMP